MATHSSIPAWEIPWVEEPGGLQYKVTKESEMTEGLNSRIANSSWLVILETHMLNE